MNKNAMRRAITFGLSIAVITCMFLYLMNNPIQDQDTSGDQPTIASAPGYLFSVPLQPVASYPRPYGVGADDATGYIYASDYQITSDVQRFDRNGNFLDTFFSSDNGPMQIAVNSTGHVFLNHYTWHQVLVYDRLGNPTHTLGQMGVAGTDNDHFNHPAGVAVNSTGYLYVLDESNLRVQIFNSACNYVRTIYPNWHDSWAQIAVNGTGYLFIADVYNQTVKVFDINGNLVRILGQPGVAGLDNAHFNTATGVAVDRTGHIYVGDQDNHRVQVFDVAGNYILTLGETGVPGTDNDHFYLPRGVAVDANGNLYVADTLNHRVQVFAAYPKIEGTGLAPGQVCGGTAPAFSLQINAINTIAQIWYSLDGGATNTTCTLTGTLSTQWGSHGNGTVPVTFWAKDAGGNIGNITITLNKDIIAPSITGTGLVPFQLFGTTAPGYSLTIAEANLAVRWYSLDGGLTNTTCGSTGTLATQWGTQPNGTVMVTFWANDSVGNVGTASVEVRKDAILPSLLISELIGGQLCNATPPSFNLTASDNSLAAAWYSLDGGLTNYTCAFNATSLMDQAAWGARGNGTVTATFWVNDTAGNVVTTSVTVHKDIIAPGITGTGLTPGAVYGLAAPAFSLAIVEANLAATWYSLDNGTTNTTCGLTGTLSAQWSGRPNGQVTITFWANDSAGNAGNITLQVTKNTLPAIESPADIAFIVATEGHSLAWNVTDPDAPTPTYWIFRNGTQNATGTWDSGVNITVDVDGLPAGTYNYTLVVNDGLGGIVQAEVLVTVINHLPAITHPPVVEYTVGSTGHSISWTITDLTISRPTYIIYRNGSVYTSGTWAIDLPVAIAVDGLSAGAYNYTIVVADGYGGISQDTVVVTVLPNVDYWGIITSVIGAVSAVAGIAAGANKYLKNKRKRSNPPSVPNPAPNPSP